MHRRTFLAGLGWAAAGVALGACGGDADGTSAGSSGPPTSATTGVLDGVSFQVHRDPG